MVARDDITLFIHAQAAIRIAIVGKTNIQALLNNKLLESLNVSRTSIQVDIQTVGLIVDNIGICTEGIKDRFCNVPAGTIGTIQTDLDSFERVNAQRDQITHVTVTACHIVYRTADMLTMGKRQFRPVLIKDMELAVDVVLHQQQRLLRHFLAIAVD